MGTMARTGSDASNASYVNYIGFEGRVSNSWSGISGLELLDCTSTFEGLAASTAVLAVSPKTMLLSEDMEPFAALPSKLDARCTVQVEARGNATFYAKITLPAPTS